MLVLVVLLMTITSFALQAQVPTEVSSSGHRPLAGALDALEVATGTAINYEDVPYENQADLEDVSTPQQRASRAGYRLLVPRKGTVSAPLQAGRLSSEADRVFQVNMLLSNYRDNKMPGDFRVEQANGMLYVIPTRVLGANGSLRELRSPMTTLITIPYGERSAIETVAAILAAVSKATRVRMDVGSLPFSPAQTVGFGAVDEPARDALARLFAKLTKSPVSYRLLFDPVMAYMFNVRTIPDADAAASETAPAPEIPAGRNWRATHR